MLEKAVSNGVRELAGVSIYEDFENQLPLENNMSKKITKEISLYLKQLF